MKSIEPTLDKIEDYKAKGSSEKRLTVWIVILSGLLVAAVYGIFVAGSSVSDSVVEKEKTGISKY